MKPIFRVQLETDSELPIAVPHPPETPPPPPLQIDPIPSFSSHPHPATRPSFSLHDSLILSFLTLGTIALHGYHFAVHDQFVYLPAIKYHLDPTLYPGGTEIFLAQTRFTLFDELVAFSIRLTHLPFEWAVLLWHVFCVWLLLLGCLQVSRRVFTNPLAQWAGVALVGTLQLLTVAATLLELADPYLHPRTLATGFLLLSFSNVLDRKPRSLLWYAAAFVVHPTMALWGGIHLACQALPAEKLSRVAVPAMAVIPVLDIGHNPAWHAVLETRWFLYPLRWPWFAWFGVFVPLALLAWWSRIETRRFAPALNTVAGRLFVSGILGTCTGLFISIVPSLERFLPMEPMRTLHLLNLLVVLLGGGLLAQCVLRRSLLRWLALFLPLCAIMFYAQCGLSAGSPHIEWPGSQSSSAWVQTFDWIRLNTPRDARFAIDPHHLERPGEGFRSFQVLAERSKMMDYTKDRGVVATWPALAPVWQQQMLDLQNWQSFRRDDFLRLHSKYGVSWVVVEAPAPPGLPCTYANSPVLVCRIE